MARVHRKVPKRQPIKVHSNEVPSIPAVQRSKVEVICPILPLLFAQLIADTILCFTHPNALVFIHLLWFRLFLVIFFFTWPPILHPINHPHGFVVISKNSFESGISEDYAIPPDALSQVDSSLMDASLPSLHMRTSYADSPYKKLEPLEKVLTLGPREFFSE